uniref:Pleckstrin y domain-containing family M member 2 n=2 Tax=Schizaphis graminum TaxID=13262 RepID=A0A2S2P3E9_SCHGA
MMSARSPDSIVHRRSNTKQVHPVVGLKRVSFHEDVIEPGNGNLIQIRIGECGEREAPEGQEDPQPSETLSKSSVLKSKKQKFPSLYLNALNVDLKSQQVVLNQIKQEMMNKECSNVWNKHLDMGSSQLINIIKRDLLLKTKESIYKIYRMLSTGGSPLFVVITNIRFFVLTKNVYTKRLEVFYSSNFTSLDLIALGPCDQTAVFVSEKSKKCTLITAIDVQSALEMIGSLEYAYRCSGFYDPNNAFVVININHDDKLYESVKCQISIPKDEKIKYYTWLWYYKESESSNNLKSHLEEFLMVKKGSIWKPRFVRLSEDILYIFEHPDQKLPCESIPLRFGRCKRVKKICTDRPYSIEILLINYPIILAPADCSQEEKWFNALSYAMAGHKNLNIESKLPDGYCCLLTSSHIVLYNFPHTITDSMLLVNMDSLKFSPSPSHYYVVIEWSCYDATIEESCNDWVVHFSCKSSCDEFISWLCTLRPDLNTLELVEKKSIQRHLKNSITLQSSLI